ncbi:MAG: hypothetical protein CR986_09675, partial [Ignavibacteriae bacterium]
MKKINTITTGTIIIIILFHLGSCKQNTTLHELTVPAYKVISRVVGEDYVDKFVFKIDTTLEQTYSLKVVNNKIYVEAASPAALCRGAYDYLFNASNSLVSWSGNNINIPNVLP